MQRFYKFSLRLRGFALLFGRSHERFGEESDTRHRNGVAQAALHDFGWIDDADGEQVFDRFADRVEAKAGRSFQDFRQHERRIEAGIGDDLPEGGFASAQENLGADCLFFGKI